MEIYEIQRGNPFNSDLIITNISAVPSAPYDLTGKTIFFTAKTLSDNGSDDTNALIKKTITSHSDPPNGKSSLALLAAETLIPVDLYKCDIRIYASGICINSDIFYIKIVDIVTKRTA
jgi:hypothetical protein